MITNDEIDHLPYVIDKPFCLIAQFIVNNVVYILSCCVREKDFTTYIRFIRKRAHLETHKAV